MTARVMVGLRPVAPNGTDHRATYCGPTALSALTNRPPERFVTWPNRRRVRVHLSEMLAALQLLCGVNTRIVCVERGKRVALWRFCSPKFRGVARVRGHLLAVDGFMVCDTLSGRSMWVADHPKRNSLVTHYIAVPERVR